jgi:DNA polymerase-4
VKPAGVRYVAHGEEKNFLAPLPIEVIPGIGAKTAPVLRERGFNTVADIQRASQAQMHSLLGEHGMYLFEIANGKGPDVLTVEWERKSISREETFAHDLNEILAFEKILHSLVEDVCSTLRSYHWKSKTIALKLRYADFKTLTRAESIDPTDDDTLVYKTVRALLQSSYNRKKSLRLLGVRLSGFTKREDAELTLFPADGKRSQMFDAIDKLREKFGDDVIHVGSS